MVPLRTQVAGLAIVLAATGATGGRATSTIKVAGSGMDHLTTALIHTKKETQTGSVQQSTEIVDLTGDLQGRVLYQVTTVIDSIHGTLVNTGESVYSGTIAGSAPVMIHDHKARFDMNLRTGKDTGHVYLFDHISGPKIKCALDVIGTGMSAEGNPIFTYTGQCTLSGART
ncbi:MAG: hypothetical protein ACRD3J_18460 [Thermoanaerobaculia bacterium]